MMNVVRWEEVSKQLLAKLIAKTNVKTIGNITVSAMVMVVPVHGIVNNKQIESVIETVVATGIWAYDNYWEIEGEAVDINFRFKDAGPYVEVKTD